MRECPHCEVEIRVAELPHPGWFADYRVCPACNEKFTTDTDTKYRQAYCLLIALISTAFTIMLYIDGNTWLVPSLASYVLLGGLIYRGNKLLCFVPYNK